MGMKRGIVGSIVVAGVMLAAVLLALVRGGPASVSAGAVLRDAQMVTPTIVSVSPRQAPNNLDTTLVITGAGFQAVLSGTQGIPPSVRLGDAELPHVGWVSLTLLTATVPWGEDPGVYTLTVVNPEGGVGTLARAFTVERAIGAWTTGGPYGGNVLDLAVSKATSRTAFAALWEVGVFRTRDAGGHWALVFRDNWPRDLFYRPSGEIVSCGGSGLWQSSNEGDDWEPLIQYESVDACAPAPQAGDQVWIGSQGGVWLVTIESDGTIERQPRDQGLPMTVRVYELAVDPVSRTVIYAGLQDGRVFRTTNGGGLWEEASTGLGQPHTEHPALALAVDPDNPEVLLYSRWLTQIPGYRSTDGAASWAVMDVEPIEGEMVTDLAFSPYVSGTVYASLWGNAPLGVSADSGETWSPLGTVVGSYGDAMDSLGLDATSGLPAYLGGSTRGAYRSEDGGETWTLATDGLSGMLVEDLAASNARPETVRVASEHAGAFTSEDAGVSWRRMEMSFPAAFALAVDPMDVDVAYIGSVQGVYRTEDGETWDLVSVPVTHHTHIEALAVSPLSPTVLYAGGRDDDAFQLDQRVGVLFRSGNRGESWTLVDVGRPISIVSDIAIAPTVTETVYVATGRDPIDAPGLGVLRSENGGASWTMTLRAPVTALAVRPDDPLTVYAAGFLLSTEDWTVFQSQDGGDSWVPTTLRLGWKGVTDVVIDPLDPETVYAGTEIGLFQSIDGGARWSRAAGALGWVSVKGLAIAARDGKTILYVGTTGGLPSIAGAEHVGRMARTDEAYVDAGVYQQTIDHRPPVGVVYLPLALRSR
jgi:hypothetical protein